MCSIEHLGDSTGRVDLVSGVLAESSSYTRLAPGTVDSQHSVRAVQMSARLLMPFHRDGVYFPRFFSSRYSDEQGPVGRRLERVSEVECLSPLE